MVLGGTRGWVGVEHRHAPSYAATQAPPTRPDKGSEGNLHVVAAAALCLAACHPPIPPPAPQSSCQGYTALRPAAGDTLLQKG